MILVGQYDSPFVRRVAIALRHYQLPFQHRPWSVWRDADKLAAINPLCRVPVLLLGEEKLIESAAILDAIDELAEPSRLLLPRSGPARREGLRLCALATGVADKAVSLLYERLLHDAPSRPWQERCQAQVEATHTQLDSERSARPSVWWLGESLSHVDVALACAWRFLHEAHPGAFDATRWPALAELAARCEDLPMFQEIQQPLTV
jgi:glutathione S-transferase